MFEKELQQIKDSLSSAANIWVNGQIQSIGNSGTEIKGVGVPVPAAQAGGQNIFTRLSPTMIFVGAAGLFLVFKLAKKGRI